MTGIAPPIARAAILAWPGEESTSHAPSETPHGIVTAVGPAAAPAAVTTWAEYCFTADTMFDLPGSRVGF